MENSLEELDGKEILISKSCTIFPELVLLLHPAPR